MADAAYNMNNSPGGYLNGTFAQGSSGNLPVYFTTSCPVGYSSCGNQSADRCEYFGDNSIRCNPDALLGGNIGNVQGALMTLLMHEAGHSVGLSHGGTSGCLMYPEFPVFSGWTDCDNTYFWLTYGS